MDGEGEEGMRGGKEGDIYILMQVKKKELLKSDGEEIY